MKNDGQPRTFKTAWFSKAARKALIADKELCDAIEQVRKGQADDLGSGVFKKRLDKNRHRSIIIAKGQRYWVYTYLFAKNDRDNITSAELAGFRDLASLYDRKTDLEIDLELKAKQLMEICHAREAQVQK